MFGLLKASGLNDRLVHLSHSCDLKPTERIPAEDEQRRQKVLDQLCRDGIEKFGPFKNVAQPFNCRTDQKAAVEDLQRAIDASTEDDPLWIVEAGEPDIIGFALEAAREGKRKFVHVISHHPANDNAGDFFKWQQILDFGVTEHQIGDQNVGLQTAINEWDWAKGNKDPNFRWIWQQLDYAEKDGVVKFQTNKFDCSDAGMVYWWITGADESGNAHATPNEIKRMLLVPRSPKLSLVHRTVVDPQALTFATGSATRFGNTVNGRTHQQLPLVTYRGYQYVTWYDSSRRVCIGRRKVADDSWDVIRFDDHRFSTNDSHNTAVLGICHLDGTIHMAFDHHATPLNYRVSKQGVANQPETVSWSADLFSKKMHSLGALPTHERVTYPRFFSASNGNLMLYYRSVTSGNGDGMIEEYDGKKHAWSRGLGVFIARDIGTYSVGGRTSEYRCPYMNSLSYAGDRLHASWIWRDRFGRTDPVNQHDLCYAYSDDHGRTWQNSDGIDIGTTGSDPIHLDSPGVVVAAIPTGIGLSNSNTHYAYEDGSVHVMLRHKVGNAGQGQYVHYWRTAEGNWNHEALPFCGGRPKLVGTADRTLALVYDDDEDDTLHVLRGQPNDSQTSWQWSKVRLPQHHSVYGEAVIDLDRWQQDNVLSIYSQQMPQHEKQTSTEMPVDGFPSALNVVDYRFEDLQ